MTQEQTRDLTEPWQETARNLNEKFDRLSENVRNSMNDSMENGKMLVQEYPLVAIGITFAAGIMTGILLGRKSRD